MKFLFYLSFNRVHVGIQRNYKLYKHELDSTIPVY